MSHERYKIGLLVANIVDDFSNQIAKGAMEAAEKLDADLFIFPGKYIGLEYLYAQFDAKYEYQYNSLFDVAARAGLDYLIVAIGTIAYACDDERKLEIMRSLGDTPKLCLAADLEGYDTINFDNRTGIAQAVEYLAGQGKKHIGMLAGDFHNNDCVERCEAYKETMERLGLEIGEGYIRECDISFKCEPQVRDYLYKRIANELLKDYRELQDGYIDRTHVNNIFIRDTLMFDRGSEDMYSSTLRRVSDIGGMTSYIYLLDEPVNHQVGMHFNADCDWYFKAYCYGHDTFAVPPAEQKLAAWQMFRNAHLPDRRFTVVVTDLYSAELQYGIALIEPKDTEFLCDLELLTYQLSSSMKTIGLLNMQESILADLHSRNMALDEMSKIDELTGIFNRRGFYLAAERLIKDTEAGSEMVVCFADMDNLKLVNDQYGHMEGDFSLRFLADSMLMIFGDGAVVGRMGGDEYAAIAPLSSCRTPEEIRARKDKLISDHAGKSGKPYKINMSMGLYTCVCENTYDLRAAIDKADDLLYAEKAKRKK